MGSNRTMSVQRPRLVFYWCCSVLFEWCFLVLRTKQRQMGVQVPETTKQNSKKFTGRRFRPELPAVSANHRPRFPPLGYFPENGGNGARGAEFSREIRVLFLHSFMDQPRLAGVVYSLVYLGLVTMAWAHNLSVTVSVKKCFY